MRKSSLISLVAAGLALFPAAAAFSAAPDPTPNRESKLLVDFENTTTVTSDPDAGGTSRQRSTAFRPHWRPNIPAVHGGYATMES